MKVLYVCQLGEPDVHDLDVYRGLAEGADDAEWFIARLRELGVAEGVSVTTARVCLGEGIPPPEGFDAAVIGGSYHMVSENRPWQVEILSWLESARARGLPTFGICGGHQLMAASRGADVTPIPGGTWGESMAVPRTNSGIGHWLFEGVDEDCPFHFGNTEHVCLPPEGVTVLASLPESPALALDYGGTWVSVQFHPEMSVEAFVRSWVHCAPERAGRYRESPQASRLLVNFLRHAGSSGANRVAQASTGQQGE